MKKYLRLLFVSFCAIVIVALLSIIYGLIIHRSFTVQYIFHANFIAGFIMILAGVVTMFLPSVLFTKSTSPLDRFTYVERSFDSREKRQQMARVVLWLGLFITVLAGLIQLLLAVVI